MDEGVSTTEAASELGVSRQAVQKMVKAGTLVARQVSRDATRKRWLIDRASLSAAVAARQVEDVPVSVTDLGESITLAREAVAGLRESERTIAELRNELEAARSRASAALTERDHQTTLAISALERVDALRSELEHLRAAHLALLEAHASLFGSTVSRP